MSATRNKALRKKCTLTGCNKSQVAKGLCYSHYMRASEPGKQRSCQECGAPLMRDNISGYCRKHLILVRWRRETPILKCTAPGCQRKADNPFSDDPLCKMHASRIYRNGTFEAKVKRALQWGKCEYCGSAIKRIGSKPKRFCSARCHARFQRNAPVVRSCAECGKIFEAPFKSNTNTCSEKCRAERARRFANAASREAGKKRRRVGRISPLPKGTHKKIGELQKWRCAICRKNIKRAYHADHIMPLARGGKHEPRNLQLLCAHCNLVKSARDPIVHMQSLGRLL